jgi:hypothetical protein
MVAEGEEHISAVIDRKSSDHIIMKRAMAHAMKSASLHTTQAKLVYNPKQDAGIPEWLSA